MNNSGLIFGITLTTDKQVRKMVEQFVRIVKNNHVVDVAIGVDAKSQSYLLAGESYEKAKRANQVCRTVHNCSCKFYNELNLDIFSAELSKQIKLEYIQRIFKDYSIEDMKESMQLLEVYYNTNGSLVATAEHLYLHRNTIQYKLKKIVDRTGYDPRLMSDMALFYNAIFFYQELDEDF